MGCFRGNVEAEHSLISLGLIPQLEAPDNGLLAQLVLNQLHIAPSFCASVIALRPGSYACKVQRDNDAAPAGLDAKAP